MKNSNTTTEMTATSNASNRTFTIRINGSKYRTNRMCKEEFQSCTHNTSNDWVNFLRNSSDYYIVK